MRYIVSIDRATSEITLKDTQSGASPPEKRVTMEEILNGRVAMKGRSLSSAFSVAPHRFENSVFVIEK
jgi:hypothetical protein